MTIISLLEDFASVSPDLAKHTPKPEDLLGYGIGFDAGRADADVQRVQALAQLAKTLEDMSFGYREAQQELTKTLKPLFQALTTHLVPECLDASLHARFFDVLEKAAKHDLDAPIKIAVHPRLVDDFAEASRSVSALPVDVTSDHEIGESEIRFQNGAHETSFDSQLLLQELVAALSAFQFVDEKKDSINE